MMRSRIYYVLMLPFFFPNVDFNIFAFDISPLPLIAALIILATTPKRYPGFLYLLWLPAILSVPFILTTFGDWPYFFRQIGTYFTVPLVSMACYRAVLIGVDIGKLAKHAIYASFICGLAQMFISPFIFSSLLYSRTTESRGYTSLFAEPSFFGMAMIMFCVIYLASTRISGSKVSWLPIGVGVTAVIALSQSSLAILILLSTILVYFVCSLNLKRAILLPIACVALIFAAPLFLSADSDARTVSLLHSFLEAPQEILLNDASVSERMMHVYLSIKGSALNFFMPNGFYEFSNLIRMEMNFNSFFWWGEPSNKIMSGIGSALYEIGFVALVTPGILIFLVLKNNFRRDVLIILVAAPIFVYSNAITFASPYFSVLVGALAIGIRRSRHQIIPVCRAAFYITKVAADASVKRVAVVPPKYEVSN